MKKTAGSYAGVVVRDHWRVYLQMRCFLSLNSDAKSLESKGQLLKSDRSFPGYHDLKVVCAGPLWIWSQLEPELGCFGWYGIKKSFYGILHEVKYKPYLPLSSVLTLVGLQGHRYRAGWFNPRNGRAIAIAEGPSGRNEWTIPNRPEPREEDWVLILNDASRAFPTPE